MKKGILFVSGIIMACMLTGCGSSNDKLVCTLSQEQNGVKMDTTATTYFNSKDVATKVTVDMVVDAGSETMAKTLVETMKDSYDDVKQDGNKVTLKKSVEPDKDDEDLTRKEAKESFEEQGYTCK